MKMDIKCWTLTTTSGAKVYILNYRIDSIQVDEPSPVSAPGDRVVSITIGNEIYSFTDEEAKPVTDYFDDLAAETLREELQSKGVNPAGARHTRGINRAEINRTSPTRR